jgi:eukaryotic-like serine/threonine-protein kinase
LSRQRKQELTDFFDEVTNDTSEEESILDSILDCSERYTDLNLYEVGGSKNIFKAFDNMSGREVAFAKLKEESSASQMDNFLREARINALLQHPNIVPVYDIGINEDEPFFCMKFIAGQTLAEIISKLQSGNPETAKEFTQASLIDVFLKICDAISYAHSHGILHLDLKPENIRIDSFGDVQLIDWGLARVIDGMDDMHDQFGSLEQYSINQNDVENMTIDGFLKGTPGYMAPEQAGRSKHRKGPCTDIYALGAILYSILCYKKPFEGDLETIIKKTLIGDFEAPSSIKNNVPEALESISLKAMESSPEKRYQSVEELHKDILSYRNGYLTSAEESSVWKVFSLFIKRNKAISFIITASLILIFTLSLFYIDSLKKERDIAKEALSLAQEEKEKRQYLSDLGVDFFIKQAKQSVVFHAFKEAENVIAQIPESEFTDAQKIQVKDLFGRITFYRQQFNKAIKLLEVTEDRDNKFLLEMARKYAPKKSSDDVLLNGDDYIQLLDELEAFHIQHAWSSYEYEVLNYTDIFEHIKAVEKMIHVKNNSIEKLNINLTEIDGKYYLDLSQNPGVHSIVGIRSMPLTGLNLSGSGIKDFRMAILKDMPLEQLNLSGCGLTNYHFLIYFKNLKQITVNSKEAKNPSFQRYTKDLEVIISP